MANEMINNAVDTVVDAVTDVKTYGKADLRKSFAAGAGATLLG